MEFVHFFVGPSSHDRERNAFCYMSLWLIQPDREEFVLFNVSTYHSRQMNMSSVPCTSIMGLLRYLESNRRDLMLFLWSLRGAWHGGRKRNDPECVFCVQCATWLSSAIACEKGKSFQEALKEFRWYGRFIKGEMVKTKLPGVFAVGAWHEKRKRTGKNSSVEVTRNASREKTVHSQSIESPQRGTKRDDKGFFKGLCNVPSQPRHRTRNC